MHVHFLQSSAEVSSSFDLVCFSLFICVRVWKKIKTIKIIWTQWVLISIKYSLRFIIMYHCFITSGVEFPVAWSSFDQVFVVGQVASHLPTKSSSILGYYKCTIRVDRFLPPTHPNKAFSKFCCCLFYFSEHCKIWSLTKLGSSLQEWFPLVINYCHGKNIELQMDYFIKNVYRLKCWNNSQSKTIVYDFYLGIVFTDTWLVQIKLPKHLLL